MKPSLPLGIKTHQVTTREIAENIKVNAGYLDGVVDPTTPYVLRIWKFKSAPKDDWTYLLVYSPFDPAFVSPLAYAPDAIAYVKFFNGDPWLPSNPAPFPSSAPSTSPSTPPN